MYWKVPVAKRQNVPEPISVRLSPMVEVHILPAFIVCQYCEAIPRFQGDQPLPKSLYVSLHTIDFRNFGIYLTADGFARESLQVHLSYLFYVL